MKKLLAIFLLLATPAFGRPWLDAAGKHHVEADLAEYQGGIAYLRKPNGHIVAVPHAKLCKPDQDYVKAATPPVKVIDGKVVSIADGDTLTVLDGTTQVKIRLEGIDAPEGHQAYGTKSREALAQKVFEKTVRIEWRERDKYGRTLGHVFVDSNWVNKAMVADGMAWHYVEYSKSEVLADAESDARTARFGLWADEHPIPPWEFRHPVATAPPAQEPPASDSPEQAEETVYVTKSGAKYHRAGCRHLKSSIPMALSEAASRYSPCAVCHPPLAKEKAPSAPAQSQASVVQPIASPPVTLNPSSTGETTATGIPIHTGPRGGKYHYSKSGKKVYERRKR